MEIYSHIIHNPNKIILNDNCHIIPSGLRCTSAISVNNASLRKQSLPFDWVIPLYPNKIIEILENNFENFLPEKNISNIFTNKYGLDFPHFPEDEKEGFDAYKRRIERFKEIFQSEKKKIFVYINEDYLYSEKDREKKFNDLIFTDMLKLDLYLKEKLKNNYTILYFNWKKENIPSNSNIINVVLNSKELFNDTASAHKKNRIDQFRQYCGKIIKNMFKNNSN